MTITLPDDLAGRLQTALQGGRFASVDDAMAEAVRLLLREAEPKIPAPAPGEAVEIGPDLFLGSLRDDAEFMDEIVTDVYRSRREETWREIDLD